LRPVWIKSVQSILRNNDQNCDIFHSSLSGSDSRIYTRTHKTILSLKRYSHRVYTIIASMCKMLSLIKWVLIKDTSDLLPHTSLSFSGSLPRPYFRVHPPLLFGTVGILVYRVSDSWGTKRKVMIDWVKLRRKVLYHFAKFAIIIKQ